MLTLMMITMTLCNDDPIVSLVGLSTMAFRVIQTLGKDGHTKTDEFLEKFQTAFDPPPLIFGKSYCAFRDKIATKVRMFSMAGLLCII